MNFCIFRNFFIKHNFCSVVIVMAASFFCAFSAYGQDMYGPFLDKSSIQTNPDAGVIRLLDSPEINLLEDEIFQSAPSMQAREEEQNAAAEAPPAQENSDIATTQSANESQDELADEISQILAEQSIDAEEYDLILRVRRKSDVLSEAVVGIQKGFENYVPFLEIARLLQVAVEPNFDQGTFRGFFIDQENIFSINLNERTFTTFGETKDLPENSFIYRTSSLGLGELYIKPDILNTIVPLGIELEFFSLTVFVNTRAKLPYELARERAERYANFGSDEEDARTGYVYIPNDNKMLGPVAGSVSSSIDWNNSNKDLRASLNVRGQNDFLGTNADYNFNFRHSDDDEIDFQNARVRFTRRSYGDHNWMPFGIQNFQAGDITASPPALVDRSIRGRGISVSTEPNIRGSSFDSVNIEGTAQPGWEVEIYRRLELLDFGIVNSRGEYFFENVPLTYGTNQIRIVLYGPQGQIEERIEEYRVSGKMLPPGKSEQEFAIINTDRDLIETDDEPRNTPSGTSKYFRSSHGFTNWLTGFSTFTEQPTEKGNQEYYSAGAIVSGLGGIGQVEAYKQIDGGTALDARFLTRLKNFRISARHAHFNDFESEEAEFDENAKTSETEIDISRNFKLPYVNANIAGNVEHIDRENDDETTDYRTRFSLSRKGTRLTNTTDTSLFNGEHTRSTGDLNLTSTLSPNWRLRNTLQYNIFPEREWDDFRVELRYDDKDKITGSFNVEQSLNTDQTRVGINADYDFGEFLAGAAMNWSDSDGIDFRIRANTSFAPYGDNGDYIYSSEGIANKGALKARLFIDNDLDGIFDPEQDDPLPDTRISLNGRTSDPSDENGFITVLDIGGRGQTFITLDAKTLDNPLLVTAEEGYKTFFRPTTIPFIDIPIVESGNVDGNLTFPGGDPIAGARIQMVDTSGELVKEFTSMSDGFYNFEYVRPGTYLLQSDPKQDLRIRPVIIEVNNENLFASGVGMNYVPLTKQEKQTMLQSALGSLNEMKTLLGAI